MLSRIETTLMDAKGEPRKYVGMTLPCEASGNLLLEVADVLEGPIASFLRSLVSGELNADAEINLTTIGNALRGIKLEGVFSRAIARGGFGLARKMLQGVKREGPTGAPFFEVGEPGGFDNVYSANLPELVRALGWVARVNWLPFSPASGAGGATP